MVYIRYTTEAPFHGVRYTAESPFRGVWYTTELSFRNHFVQYLREYSAKFKSFQSPSYGARRCNLMQKTTTQKSVDTVPLKNLFSRESRGTLHSRWFIPLLLIWNPILYSFKWHLWVRPLVTTYLITFYYPPQCRDCLIRRPIWGGAIKGGNRLSWAPLMKGVQTAARGGGQGLKVVHTYSSSPLISPKMDLLHFL